jgi:hypothetical protein
MKFIINENQYKRIFESQEYMNTLLDKISSEGMDSLSRIEKEALERMSRGEELTPEDMLSGEVDDVYNPNSVFKDLMSQYNELEADGNIYTVSPLSIESSVIEISGEDFEFLVDHNFGENEVILYIPDRDESVQVKYKNIPETKEGMRKLVLKLLYQTLPEFITKNKY